MYGSAVGAIIVTCIAISWIITFQLTRVNWGINGVIGDKLLAIYPKGNL